MRKDLFDTLLFQTSSPVETFIELLKDIDSPNEITEYVNTYLGQSKLSRDFSKNFILKRSYLRNKGKTTADQLEVSVADDDDGGDEYTD